MKSNLLRRWARLPMLAFLLMLSGYSYGDMLISPLRLMLDNDHRTGTLTLRNTADGPRTFRLEWQEKVMDEDGHYRDVGVDDPAVRPASPMVRFSPRQITVGPGENQTVRLNYRPPADLAPGEYRSHLLFKVLADVSEPTMTMNIGSPQDGITMTLDMQMSFSLPITVRNDVAAPRVSISDVTVVDDNGKKALQLVLDRSGDSGSYGRLVVEAQKDAASPVERIGFIDEVAVFADMSRRVIRVPLKNDSVPAGYWVRVAYEGKAEYTGVIWDEKVFKVR